MSMFNTGDFANKLFTSEKGPTAVLCQHTVAQFIALNISVLLPVAVTGEQSVN
jgi:hypothetical protein